MLLRFAVANHLSIRDEQEVSFVANSSRTRDEIRIRSEFSPSGFVLPSVLLLGANGSGKSNLVHAIKTMQNVVLWSHTRTNSTGHIPRYPFQRDQTYAHQPSMWELDFVADNVPYHYKFIASNDRFLFESLCAFPNSRQQLLFERNEHGFRFGRNLKGQNKRVAKVTRANSLYLSTAAYHGHEQIERVFQYFKTIDVLDKRDVHDATLMNEFQSAGPDQRVIEFLKELGTGVVGYHHKSQEQSEKPAVVHQSVRPAQNTSLASNMQVPIDLTYHDINGHEMRLPLAFESSGILRMLILLNRVFRSLDSGGILCVDELGGSLHTRVIGEIIQLFSFENTNPNRAQLLATIHDTNVLQSVALRSDQYWFTEKDFHGATTVYPMSDFRIRKSWDLEKGYLHGRFGAVPPRGFFPMFGVYDHEE